jgi:hypothetical protein
MLALQSPPTHVRPPPQLADTPDEAPSPAPESVVTLPVSVFLCLLALVTTRPPKRRSPPSKLRLLRWQKILAALSDTEPRTGKELARAAGLRDDSQLRGDLSELQRQGKAKRKAGEWGYTRIITTEVAS